MDNRKDDSYFAKKSLEHIAAIKTYVSGKTYEDFMRDEEIIDAVMFRIIQLTENVKRFSAEFKEEHSEFPWGELIGFRNGIVHDYGKTDYSIVYDSIVNDFDDLEEILLSFLGE